jgi:hypothetical protein
MFCARAVDWWKVEVVEGQAQRRMEDGGWMIERAGRISISAGVAMKDMWE